MLLRTPLALALVASLVAPGCMSPPVPPIELTVTSVMADSAQTWQGRNIACVHESRIHMIEVTVTNPRTVDINISVERWEVAWKDGNDLPVSLYQGPDVVPADASTNLRIAGCAPSAGTTMTQVRLYDAATDNETAEMEAKADILPYR